MLSLGSVSEKWFGDPDRGRFCGVGVAFFRLSGPGCTHLLPFIRRRNLENSVLAQLAPDDWKWIQWVYFFWSMVFQDGLWGCRTQGGGPVLIFLVCGALETFNINPTIFLQYFITFFNLLYPRNLLNPHWHHFSGSGFSFGKFTWFKVLNYSNYYLIVLKWYWALCAPSGRTYTKSLPCEQKI
jgi:hypothetical protein